LYIFSGRGYAKGIINDLPDAKNIKLPMEGLHDISVADLCMNHIMLLLYYYYHSRSIVLAKIETGLIIPAEEISFKKTNKLNINRCGPSAKIIDEELLTIESMLPMGATKEDDNVACVQAVDPFDPEESKYGYFEVTILETCSEGQ
jgi:hypothetical protein